jgi:predicted esterase
MSFDYTVLDNGIEYGVVRGGAEIIFMKMGLGTDRLWPDSRYAVMARRLHEGDGCSVIVATNPHDGASHAEHDRAVLERYISEQGIGNPAVFFFGNSNGCIKGLELTACGISFRRMVLVNMPLMINFHKTKEYIARIPQTHILAVFGERDPSVSYVPFLEGRFENLRVLTVSGADHNFKGMENEFIGLSDFLRG